MHWQAHTALTSAPGNLKIAGKDTKLLEIDIGRLKIKHVLGKLNMYWEIKHVLGKLNMYWEIKHVLGN
jgi:hypothetical protein